MLVSSRVRRDTKQRTPVNTPARRRFRPESEPLESRSLLSGLTYIVNSLRDTGAGSGLDGDLRYAITQADKNPGSTIDFSVTGSIQLSKSLPPIAANMTINGPGSSSLTVKGGGSASNFSPFMINSGVTAAISNLTVAQAGAPVMVEASTTRAT